MSKPFELLFTTEALNQTKKIMNDSSRDGLRKQLKKTFSFLSTNPNHPGLKSHPISQFDDLFGGKVFTSYVQNNTPQAHRILWLYGPEKNCITVVAVIPHY